MANPIHGISPIGAGVVDAARRAGATTRSEGPDFATALGEAIGQASDAGKAAEQKATAFADGSPDVGMHEVMIASEKANISLRYAVTLKNKLVDAYREIMNTQI